MVVNNLYCFLLFFALASCRISKTWNHLIFPDALGKEYKQGNKLDSLREILTHSELNHITVNGILGSGGFGIVFSALNNGNEVSVKIHLEQDSRYSECSQAWESYLLITRKGPAKYLIEMSPPIKFKTKRFFACVLIMEKGVDLYEPLFSADQNNKIMNTYKLIDFMVKIIDAFAHLHFKLKIYHGDVKPANLLAVKIGRSQIMEPRIIDLDFVFEKESPFFNPNKLIYTQGFRPPELVKIVPGVEFSKAAGSVEKTNLSEYLFDELFREEAYTVGLTLFNILKINRPKILWDDVNLNKFRAILLGMVQEEISERISTKAALDMCSSLNLGQTMMVY